MNPLTVAATSPTRHKAESVATRGATQSPQSGIGWSPEIMAATKYKPYDYGHSRPMRAKLPPESVMNGQWYDGKEIEKTVSVIAYHKGEFKEPVKVRLFVGRSRSATTVYCTIWTHGRDGKSFNGHGQAGGYGYHKGSAALAEAIRNAGIELDMSISGVGESAMERAVTAIARALGYRKTTIINS